MQYKANHQPTLYLGVPHIPTVWFAQAAWDLGQVYAATDGRYLEVQPATPVSGSPVTPPDMRVRAMPENLYNEAVYRKKYNEAVEKFVQGLDPGI